MRQRCNIDSVLKILYKFFKIQFIFYGAFAGID